jgi:hypothetical protein
MANWLKAVKLDADQKESPIGSFFIGETEPIKIDVDSLHLTYLVYDKRKGIFQVGLEFGGYDKDGVFHEDPKYARFPHLIPWRKSDSSGVWDRLDLDNFLETYAPELANTIAEWMHQGDAAKALASVAGIEGKVASYICTTDGATVLSAIKADPIKRESVPFTEPIAQAPIEIVVKDGASAKVE